LPLGACTPASGNHGFEIRAVQIQQSRRQLRIALEQDAQLSFEARRALQNGVPLTIRVNTEVRDANTLTLLADQELRFEIRYLPLSDRYQLSYAGVPESGRSFPRLRHVLADFGNLDLTMPTGPLVPGDYEFRVRVRLDRSSLPMPMQLPAVIVRNWRHDSQWTQWPFTVSA
jgi:hypothetical protein